MEKVIPLGGNKTMKMNKNKNFPGPTNPTSEKFAMKTKSLIVEIGLDAGCTGKTFEEMWQIYFDYGYCDLFGNMTKECFDAD